MPDTHQPTTEAPETVHRTVRLRLYPGDAATGILLTAIAGATVSLAAVVRIVQVSTVSPGLRSASDPVSAAPSGTVQRSHRPAKTRGAPSRSPNSQGWRVPPRRCHS